MDEIKVTRKYQVTIPKSVREKLGIKIGDKMLIKVEEDKIVLIPVKPEKALRELASIANKYFGGPKRVDAVKLVEESLEKEAGLH